MSSVVRRNRKASDSAIVRLNSIGLSLGTIGERYNCHPTSITLRLKSLGIPAADTRRAFMDDIFQRLPVSAQEEVADILVPTDGSPSRSIKDLMRDLLMSEIERCRIAVHNDNMPENDNLPVIIPHVSDSPDAKETASA